MGKNCTKKSGGVDRRGCCRVDLSKPSGDHAGPSDHAQVPGLTQHRHQKRRQDPEAGPYTYHIRHPLPAVRSPPERRRKWCLLIDLRDHHHTRSTSSFHHFTATRKRKFLLNFFFLILKFLNYHVIGKEHGHGSGHETVENGDDDDGARNSDGNILHRVPDFFRHGRNGVVPNVT